jgi:antitoxin component of RelBE/YafQ-DinJ toxin-antitoxin module
VALNVRLDTELEAMLDAYCEKTGLSKSQASRTLLREALSDLPADVAYRRGVAIEGVMLGLRALKKRLGNVVQEAMQEARDGIEDE